MAAGIVLFVAGFATCWLITHPDQRAALVASIARGVAKIRGRTGD